MIMIIAIEEQIFTTTIIAAVVIVGSRPAAVCKFPAPKTKPSYVILFAFSQIPLISEKRENCVSYRADVGV